MITLQNQWLSIGIKKKGAELCSIFSLEKKIEYIWQADPKYWGRHSCILFPIVGRLKNGQFTQDGIDYSIAQHGFVRDLDFEVISQNETYLSMGLRSNEETLKMYPYHFSIEINYTLDGHRLSIEYVVGNNDSQMMPFSIGAHPAFNCPIHPDEDRCDYALLFNKPEEAWSRCLDEDGLINDDERLIIDNEELLHLEEDIFDEDALIFEDLSSSKVTLLDSEGAPVWTFDFSNFPYLGIWSKDQESPFVCIEPWYGIADTIHSNGNLFEKEGTQVLEPGNSFSCEHSVTIH